MLWLELRPESAQKGSAKRLMLKEMNLVTWKFCFTS